MKENRMKNLKSLDLTLLNSFQQKNYQESKSIINNFSYITK